MRLVFALLVLAVVSISSSDAAAARKIDHLIVIMYENRAFDHMLGGLMAQNPNIDGLSSKMSNPTDPLNPASPLVHASFDAEPVIGSDPPHTVGAMERDLWGSFVQMDPPPMSGFVASARAVTPMRAYNSSTVPVISTLAMQFGICDRYFASGTRRTHDFHGCGY